MRDRLYTISPGEHIPHIEAGVVLGVLSIESLDIRAKYKVAHHSLCWDIAAESIAGHYEVENILLQSHKIELGGDTYYSIVFSVDITAEEVISYKISI